MNCKKCSMMLIVTALACAAGVPTDALAMPPGAPGQKKIGFTLVRDFEKKVPNANAAIFFAYYDPKKREWQKATQPTDSSGKCSFLVPTGEQGESYTFLYATAQPGLDKAIKEVSDGKGLAWRIPPGEQEDLELLTDGSSQSNTKGTVKMWRIPREITTEERGETPRDPIAHVRRGAAYAAERQYDRAIEEYNKAIALDPNLAPAYHNRGIAYGEKGQYDRAIQDYNKAIVLDPNLAQAYIMRAATYSIRGQNDTAIEDCNKAIAVNPNLAEAYTTRGAAYADKGQDERASSDFRKACDMGNEKGCKLLQLLLQARPR